MWAEGRSFWPYWKCALLTQKLHSSQFVYCSHSGEPQSYLIIHNGHLFPVVQIFFSHPIFPDTHKPLLIAHRFVRIRLAGLECVSEQSLEGAGHLGSTKHLPASRQLSRLQKRLTAGPGFGLIDSHSGSDSECNCVSLRVCSVHVMISETLSWRSR